MYCMNHMNMLPVIIIYINVIEVLTDILLFA